VTTLMTLLCISWVTGSRWPVCAGSVDRWLSYSRSLWVLIAWLRWCQITWIKWNVWTKCRTRTKHDWSCTGRVLMQWDSPPLLELVHHLTMRGWGMAYRKLEEVLQDQEGGPDVSIDPPHPRKRRATYQKTGPGRPHYQWSRTTHLSFLMR